MPASYNHPFLLLYIRIISICSSSSLVNLLINIWSICSSLLLNIAIHHSYSSLLLKMPHVNMSSAESTFHTVVDVLLPYHHHYVTRMFLQLRLGLVLVEWKSPTQILTWSVNTRAIIHSPSKGCHLTKLCINLALHQ